MKKKLLSLVILIINTVSAYAYDIAVKNADGVTIFYNYTNNGTELEVTSGNSEYKGIVNIPETVTYMNRTRYVTSIGYKAFWYCYYMNSSKRLREASVCPIVCATGK